jgi:uncharacterized repeat protein (TIGR03847 family)
MLIELDPVDRITADAVGPPGQRVFYLQGRKGHQLVTLLVEKQQVQLLAASVVEILARVGKETGQGPPEDEMALDEPIVPEWRAGRLSIGYQDERDLLMLEAEELLDEGSEEGDDAEEDDDEDEDADDEDLDVLDDAESLEDLERMEGGAAREPGRIRFWATREQMLALARHGALVCAAGRPLCPECGNPMDPEGHQCPPPPCQLCGNPMDPEGHQCPALNGQRKIDPE